MRQLTLSLYLQRTLLLVHSNEAVKTCPQRPDAVREIAVHQPAPDCPSSYWLDTSNSRESITSCSSLLIMLVLLSFKPR